MKYSVGQKIWCKIYSKLLTAEDMLYCGPAIIEQVMLTTNRYAVRCPISIGKYSNKWEWLVREQDIDYEI